jgi:threonine/homoserine/homoserine lactone efflux protein
MNKTTIYESLGFLMGFLGLGIAYYAIHLGIRLERTKRELEHKERMRAFELGRSLPGDVSWLSPQRAGALVAAAVPIVVVSFAALSSMTVGYHEGTWVMAGIVSCFAVFCGTMLCGHASAGQSQNAPQVAANIEKEQIEDDAYDVVSSRG